MKSKTLDMTMIALMTVVIIICSQIMIPMTIPFSLQTFAVFAALRILGGLRGTVSVALYLLMGAAGLPGFTGFQGGVHRLLGPTGGYLAGFLLTALIYWLFEKQAEKGLVRKWIVMIAGLLACYVAGTAWFAARYANGRTVWAILMLCVVPFVLPDLVKLVLADLVGSRVRKQLKKSERA